MRDPLSQESGGSNPSLGTIIPGLMASSQDALSPEVGVGKSVGVSTSAQIPVSLVVLRRSHLIHLMVVL